MGRADFQYRDGIRLVQLALELRLPSRIGGLALSDAQPA